MKHPFQYCAIRDWLCCVHIDPEVTCCLFAIFAIVVGSFSGTTNVGIWHWAVYLASIWNFLSHLLAGVILFLGGLWGKEVLKLVYCWLCLLNLISDICAIIAFALLHKTVYIIWVDKSNKGWSFMIPFANYITLFFWDLISPMVILGNLDDDDDVVTVDEEW